MDANQSTIQRLEHAVQIVEAKLGNGSANANAQLVAAVLQSLTNDAQTKEICAELERLGATIAQSAAVAAGS